MPFGKYKDFNDCTSKNKDKKSPGGYCAEIERRIKKNAIQDEKRKKDPLDDFSY